ncbi:MAG: carbon-nitrogen hydrolase family protein [bacterium]|nr:carbon-nitrogen hydrolase family protein [bacterium]
MNIRIAQIRVVPEKGKLRENHAKLMSVLSEIAGHWVDVVVTPECFLDGYVSTEEWVDANNIKDYAIDPFANAYVGSISAWARNHSAWVILGCSRLSPQGVYNTALVFNRRGDLHGFYDKTHCQTHDKKYVPGQKIGVFDSDFGVFGVMICADRRWPETVRSLALQGARIIFNPSYGMHGVMNLRMMQTRSYESEIFIAFTHPCQSLLTDPTGKVIENVPGNDSCFSINEIDLSEADRIRQSESAHLRDRRTDIYSC